MCECVLSFAVAFYILAFEAKAMNAPEKYYRLFVLGVLCELGLTNLALSHFHYIALIQRFLTSPRCDDSQNLLMRDLT